MKRFEYDRVSPESVGIPSDSIRNTIEELEKVTEMHGIMIMRHGKVCAEGWWAPYAPGLRHGLQSLSKAYVSTAIGIAYTEGLLTLDERIVDIFPDQLPEIVSENLSKITIKDLLIMGSGMDTRVLGRKDWLANFLATPVTHEPGTSFFYNSLNTSACGAIIYRKTGKSLSDYLCEKLFSVIGIDARNTCWMRTRDGVEYGGGGFLATTEDSLRLMDLYLRGGVWDGTRILAEDYVKMATSKQIETKDKIPDWGLDHEMGYGFQLWMCQPEESYRADGAFGQYSIVFPKLDMIISITETTQKDDEGSQRPLDVLYKWLLPECADAALAENAEAWGRLKHRMNSLALPRPEYKPYSPIAAEISDVIYENETGKLFFSPYDVCPLHGRTVSPGIEDFSIHFNVGECVINYTENGVAKSLTAAMDGTRRLNIIPNKNTVFHKLCASAYWQSENVLALQCRWIESSYEHRVFFEFNGISVTARFEDLILPSIETVQPALFLRAHNRNFGF